MSVRVWVKYVYCHWLLSSCTEPGVAPFFTSLNGGGCSPTRPIQPNLALASRSWQPYDVIKVGSLCLAFSCVMSLKIRRFCRSFSSCEMDSPQCFNIYSPPAHNSRCKSALIHLYAPLHAYTLINSVPVPICERAQTRWIHTQSLFLQQMSLYSCSTVYSHLQSLWSTESTWHLHSSLRISIRASLIKKPFSKTSSYLLRGKQTVYCRDTVEGKTGENRSVRPLLPVPCVATYPQGMCLTVNPYVVHDGTHPPSSPTLGTYVTEIQLYQGLFVLRFSTYMNNTPCMYLLCVYLLSSNTVFVSP